MPQFQRHPTVFSPHSLDHARPFRLGVKVMKELESDDAEAKDVAFLVVVGMSGELLRRRVGSGPDV